MSNHVLVIGAALLDIKGKPTAGLEPHTSNPARVRHARGGTARNVAENLGRLGAEVIMLSAVGDDEIGRQLLQQTEAAGVDVSRVQLAPGKRTGSYMALLEPDGALAVALNDTGVMEQVTPGSVYQHRRLFRDAEMIFFDGSLPENTIEMVVRLGAQYHRPICTDPSSTRLAYKLQPYLRHFRLAVPNEREAAVLCQAAVLTEDPENSLHLARQLHSLGIGMAVLTRTDFGFAYATTGEYGYIPVRYGEIVDSTGTGDAITSAIMFGLLNDMPPVACMRLGAAAASLTLQTAETVCPDLSLDLLYEHLVA